MKIWSKHFKNGDVIPSEFTCDGKDISPALEWSGVPGDAKSLALVVDDPDAPAGLWVHWILINISSYSSKIPSNGPLPMGAEEIRNDFGNTNYGGPCPPGGIHRYFFRLYALNIAKLEGVTRSNYADMIKNHTIAYAEYMGKYKRKQ